MNQNAEYPTIACVIMASGLGRRFGGNKLMANLGGMPMIAHILNATRALFARRIVVTRHADVAAYCRGQGSDVLLHDLPRRNDTIRLGLASVAEGMQGCIFCPGDQPLLRRETIQAMCNAHLEEKNRIIQPCGKDSAGTPVLFPKHCFDDLLNLPEGCGGNVLLKKNPERIRFVSVQDEYELMDVDNPADLEYIQKYMEQ